LKIKCESCNSKRLVGYIETIEDNNEDNNNENIKEVGLICLSCGNLIFNEIEPSIEAVPIIQEIGFQ